MNTPRNSLKERSTRSVRIVIAIIITASVSGFFMGIQQNREVAESSKSESYAFSEQEPESSQNTRILTARAYNQLQKPGFRANDRWFNHVKNLSNSELIAGKTWHIEYTEGQTRDQRRAYNGAPPTVPHPIDQHESQSCVVCHSQAILVDQKVAPQMSHPYYTNCIQCHVAAEGLGSRWNTSNYDLHTGNGFSGMVSIGLKGERAYENAPPTIPHSTWMRQTCLSCHGPLGTAAIQTAHPDRSNCLQCHASQPSSEQLHYGESAFPFRGELVMED